MFKSKRPGQDVTAQTVAGEVAAALRRGQLVIFAGAGVSKPSGLPTASELIGCALEAVMAYGSLSADLKASLLSAATRDLRFEVFLRYLIPFLGEKAFLALNYLDGGEPGTVHAFAASAFQQGRLRHVFTTNFDLLFERACSEQSVLFHPIVDDASFAGWQRAAVSPAIFKLHGSLSSRSSELPVGIVADVREVAQGLSDHKTATLKKLLETHTFLFVGYSGRDYFGAMPVIFGSKLKRIIWVAHSTGATTSPVVPHIAHWLKAHRDGTYVEADTTSFIREVAAKAGVAIPSAVNAKPSARIDPFTSASKELRMCADVLAGALFEELGMNEEAYDCYTCASNRFNESSHARLVAMAQLGAGRVAHKGYGGWQHEFSAEYHFEYALKTAQLAEDDVLAKEALIECLDAHLSTTIVPFGLSISGLLLQAQDVLDFAMARGLSELAGRASKLLAEAFMQYDFQRHPEMLDTTINMYEDVRVFQEHIAAQDLLASTYYRLAVLYYGKNDLERELQMNVARLRSLLLVRTDVEHPHVQSCLRMIRRTLDRVGKRSKIGKQVGKDLEVLGFS